MDFNTFCLKMRQEVAEYAVGGRENTSAFLIWFLENYFRLDSQEAISCVCDHTNDKGIDAIYVDDEEEIIYVFQSKFSPNNDADQGDVDIRGLVGSTMWFQNETSVNDLLNSTASRELKALVTENSIIEKTNYKKVPVFVTNKKFNTHANEYLTATNDIEPFDCDMLFQKYTFFADNEIAFPNIDLYLGNNTTKIEYNLPDGTPVRVYSIKAKELMKLQGIQDRTLFYKNVRYGVGKTRVNKSIKETILDTEEHDNFFLYHNGITIICSDLVEDIPHEKISIGGYAVINGCQSMLTFFENNPKLGNHLFILVKIIKLNNTSPLIKKITYYANNQNSISLKDLRSNDSVQKALQREFTTLFGGAVLYKRKKGESEIGFTEIIEKDFAAQLVEAVYLGNPHFTHLKQKLFGDDYSKIYSRKINAEKIYFAYSLYNIINKNADLLSNILIRNYGLSIFFFAHAISEILKEDALGAQIIANPKEYVTTNKVILNAAIKRLWELITPDINFDIDEYTTQHDNYFDYKNVFKNSAFVKSMALKIKTDYIRLVRRDNQYSFSSIYNSILNAPPTP